MIYTSHGSLLWEIEFKDCVADLYSAKSSYHGNLTYAYAKW